ncbi:aminopeptidase [Patescibacteria group bacterium]|nr:aminopeptidase [Patescibacteria group bacterium]
MIRLIKQEELKKWAEILLNHSSLGGINPGERVMVKGEAACWELMAELERHIILAGGIPDIYLIPPNNCRGRVWSSAMGFFGTSSQFIAIPDWHRARYDSMDKYVEILGTEDPSMFNFLDGNQAMRLAKADSPFAGIRVAKPWVLTLFPTKSGAELEGFETMEQYVDFLVEASTSNPATIKDAADQLAPIFQQAKTMKLYTVAPKDMTFSLKIDLGNTLVRKCCGERNWPDGEIFRSPDPRRTNGEIFLDLPVFHQGDMIHGIYLEFENGVVVNCSAIEGEETLRSIVETDAGSRRLGEVALGMNPGLTHVMKEPLYVEKVGGTAHIALGRSYEECYPDLELAKKNGTFNDSAQHVDLVVDFRKGGAGWKLYLDNTQLVVKDGMWAVAD